MRALRSHVNLCNCLYSSMHSMRRAPAGMMMDDGLDQELATFCRQHMASFEDSEENKLEHMDVFKRYVQLVEQHLLQKVTAEVPEFDLAAFVLWLEEQESNGIGSDAVDMLLTATDFEAFKQHMLSFKTEVVVAGLAPDVRGFSQQSRIGS